LHSITTLKRVTTWSVNLKSACYFICRTAGKYKMSESILLQKQILPIGTLLQKRPQDKGLKGLARTAYKKAPPGGGA
jgi:hypothetical protein